MTSLATVLVVVIALGAVALLAWILAFGVEAGVAAHKKEAIPEADAPAGEAIPAEPEEPPPGPDGSA